MYSDEAIFNEHLELAKHLKSVGTDVHGVNSQGNSVMHTACTEGFLPAVQFFIECAHVSVDEPGDYGWTPLFWCMDCKNQQKVHTHTYMHTHTHAHTTTASTCSFFLCVGVDSVSR